jgi:hypothetical protein
MASHREPKSRGLPPCTHNHALTALPVVSADREHTTLLLLHEAVQFVDNNLECPAAHPAFAEWEKLAAEKEASRAAEEAQEVAKVYDKLDGMITKFVNKFGELRGWKDAHPQQWGGGHHRRGKKGFAPPPSRSAPSGGRMGAAPMAMGSAPPRMPPAYYSAPPPGCPPPMPPPPGCPPPYSAPPAAAAPSMPMLMAAAAPPPPPPPAYSAPLGCPPPAPRPAPASAPMPVGAAAAAPPQPPSAALRAMMATEGAANAFDAEEDDCDFDDDDECDGSDGGWDDYGGWDAPPEPQLEAAAALAKTASAEEQEEAAADEMEDALVRASSLDSLDRQSSNGSGPPPTPKAAVDAAGREAYLGPIRAALQTSTEAGYAEFLKHKAVYGMSPSFYLYSAQAFRKAEAPAAMCLKIVSNVLETSLCNAQTCRVVAYFVLSIGLADLAVTAFENVLTLAPEEPQSQTDLAFARFFRLRGKVGKKDVGELGADAKAEAQAELKGIVELLVFILRKTDIPQRFAEIEWPVLILLSWAVDWAEWRGVFPQGEGSCWPEEELPAAKHRLDSCKLDVFIWLGWDTDKTGKHNHSLSVARSLCSRPPFRLRHRPARQGAHRRGGLLLSQPLRNDGGSCQPRLHARIRAGGVHARARTRWELQRPDQLLRLPPVRSEFLA